MARRTIVLSLGLVVLGGSFFGLVLGATQGDVYRDPSSTVLTCSAEAPIPEPGPVVDYGEPEARHRPAFVRATREQFVDVDPETARYYELHDAVHYRGTVYHCRTDSR